MKGQDVFDYRYEYKVESFFANDMKEINQYLENKNLDARDVINIIHDETHDHWYEIIYIKKVNREKENNS